MDKILFIVTKSSQVRRAILTNFVRVNRKSTLAREIFRFINSQFQFLTKNKNQISETYVFKKWVIGSMWYATDQLQRLPCYGAQFDEFYTSEPEKHARSWNLQIHQFTISIFNEESNFRLTKMSNRFNVIRN